MTTIVPGDLSLTPSFKLRQYPIKGQRNFAEWTFKPLAKNELMLSMFLGHADVSMGTGLVELARKRLMGIGFMPMPAGTDIDNVYVVEGKEDGGEYVLLGPITPAGQLSRDSDYPLLLAYMKRGTGDLFIRTAEDFSARMVPRRS